MSSGSDRILSLVWSGVVDKLLYGIGQGKCGRTSERVLLYVHTGMWGVE